VCDYKPGTCHTCQQGGICIAKKADRPAEPMPANIAAEKRVFNVFRKLATGASQTTKIVSVSQRKIPRVAN